MICVPSIISWYYNKPFVAAKIQLFQMRQEAVSCVSERVDYPLLFVLVKLSSGQVNLKSR